MATPTSDKFSRRIDFYKNLAWILIALGAAAAAYGYFAVIGWRWPWPVSKDDLAQFGSYLQGAVASIWSLAAFLFVYVAFLGQQQELEHARSQAAAQERTAVQQRFENSFFELLGLHRDLRTEINITNPNNPNDRVQGSRAVSSLVQVLRVD